MILGDPSAAVAAPPQHGQRRLTIDEVFGRIALKYPDRPALIDAPNRETFTDGAPRGLTYGEADRVVTAIAGRLHLGGWTNVLSPAYAEIAILAGIGLGAALGRATEARAQAFALTAACVQLAPRSSDSTITPRSPTATSRGPAAAIAISSERAASRACSAGRGPDPGGGPLSALHAVAASAVASAKQDARRGAA